MLISFSVKNWISRQQLNLSIFFHRSATLSRGPEIYGRSGLDYFFAAEEANDDDDDIIESNDVEVDAGEWQLLDKVRKQDIKLLKTLNIGTIIDLMVEKKKVKFGLK